MEIQQPKQFSQLDEFKILKQLGSGTEANVKLAEDPNGIKVAIKKYKQQKMNPASLEQQVSIIKNFTHQNIIKLIDCRPQAKYTKKNGQSYTCSAIILQYAGGGELFDFIADSGRFQQKVARSYFGQLMNGLHHMHEKGYVHRDLKPENLLLSELFQLKIGDFGFTTLKMRNNGVLKSRLGTHGYMAPEIYELKYDGEKVDIFAAGVILFIMYSGVSPFEKATKLNPFYLAIIKKDYPRFWGYFEKKTGKDFFSPKFKNLIQKMIAFDPKERLSIVQIAQHPWIQGEIPTYQELKAEFDMRKLKVDEEIAKRKAEEELKKQQLKNKMNEQPINGRGSQSLLQGDDNFLENFRAQIHMKRKVPLIEDLENGDVILSEELPYTIVRLKTFLKNLQLNINCDPFNSPESHPNSQKPDVLHLVNLQDENSHQILAQFEYESSFGEQEEEIIVQKLVVKFTFGKNGNGKVVLRCEAENGDWFYCRRVIAEVRKLFAV